MMSNLKRRGIAFLLLHLFCINQVAYAISPSVNATQSDGATSGSEGDLSNNRFYLLSQDDADQASAQDASQRKKEKRRKYRLRKKAQMNQALEEQGDTGSAVPSKQSEASSMDQNPLEIALDSSDLTDADKENIKATLSGPGEVVDPAKQPNHPLLRFLPRDLGQFRKENPKFQIPSTSGATKIALTFLLSLPAVAADADDLIQGTGTGLVQIPVVASYAQETLEMAFWYADFRAAVVLEHATQVAEIQKSNVPEMDKVSRILDADTLKNQRINGLFWGMVGGATVGVLENIILWSAVAKKGGDYDPTFVAIMSIIAKQANAIFAAKWTHRLNNGTGYKSTSKIWQFVDKRCGNLRPGVALGIATALKVTIDLMELGNLTLLPLAMQGELTDLGVSSSVGLNVVSGMALVAGGLWYWKGDKMKEYSKPIVLTTTAFLAGLLEAGVAGTVATFFVDSDDNGGDPTAEIRTISIATGVATGASLMAYNTYKNWDAIKAWSTSENRWWNKCLNCCFNRTHGQTEVVGMELPVVDPSAVRQSARYGQPVGGIPVLIQK